MFYSSARSDWEAVAGTAWTRSAVTGQSGANNPRSGTSLDGTSFQTLGGQMNFYMLKHVKTAVEFVIWHHWYIKWYKLCTARVAGELLALQCERPEAEMGHETDSKSLDSFSVCLKIVGKWQFQATIMIFSTIILAQAGCWFCHGISEMSQTCVAIFGCSGIGKIRRLSPRCAEL